MPWWIQPIRRKSRKGCIFVSIPRVVSHGFYPTGCISLRFPGVHHGYYNHFFPPKAFQRVPGIFNSAQFRFWQKRFKYERWTECFREFDFLQWKASETPDTREENSQTATIPENGEENSSGLHGVYVSLQVLKPYIYLHTKQLFKNKNSLTSEWLFTASRRQNCLIKAIRKSDGEEFEPLASFWHSVEVISLSFCMSCFNRRM